MGERDGRRPGGDRPGEERWLTVAEVVAIMRLSRTTVYRLVADGRLPAVRAGRAVRVPESAVHTHLRQTLPPDLA